MKFKSPVYHVVAVPIDKIVPNTYNPNTVAPPEMKLLYDSIKQDGYTMPIVCYHDQEQDQYIIVDGFHRYRIMLDYPDIYEREEGKLPVSIIDKPLAERMASTIRHNRARGSHDVDLMSNIVQELHDIGRSDKWIAQHLGMDKDEILRLKQLTGLMSLFKETQFSRAWRPVDDEDMPTDKQEKSEVQIELEETEEEM
ncbi:MAG TPA: ParB-like nuclease domain-containing protein [Candidatus Faecimorpha stercoravium]|nr:ParB-like nuclease domain-containing protein [Candidatus Faecimorpha stercoravium]